MLDQRSNSLGRVGNVFLHQDSSDTIGYPQFYGGSYNINDTTGLLTKITFNYDGGVLTDKDQLYSLYNNCKTRAICS